MASPATLAPKHTLLVSLLSSIVVLSPALAMAQGHGSPAATGPGPAMEGAAAGEDTAASRRANELFAQGSLAVKKGNFREAQRLYREAWAIRQTADVATNLALVELELGNHAAAARLFAHALRHPLPSTKPAQQRVAEQGFEEARAQVATLSLSVTPADAHVIVDGEPVATEERAEVYVMPGRHEITATTARSSAVASVTVSRGEARHVELTVTEAPPASAEPPSAGPDASPAAAPVGEAPRSGGSGPRKAVLWTEGALAVGLAVAGSVVAARSGALHRDAGELRDDAALQVGENGCAGATIPICRALDDRLEQSERARGAAIGLFVTSGVFAGALVATALAWKRPRAGRARLELVPDPVARGSLVSLRGSFY